MQIDPSIQNVVIAYPEQGNCKIPHAPVQEFCDYCLTVKPQAAFANRVHFDGFKLRRWLGYIMVLDYLPDLDDLRYRTYGARIAEYSGFDMTGRLVSDFNSPVGQFFSQLYRDSIAQKQIIYSEHTGVHAERGCDWHRVICPVSADDAIEVVACNYPILRQKPGETAP